MGGQINFISDQNLHIMIIMLNNLLHKDRNTMCVEEKLMIDQLCKLVNIKAKLETLSTENLNQLIEDNFYGRSGFDSIDNSIMDDGNEET